MAEKAIEAYMGFVYENIKNVKIQNFISYVLLHADDLNATEPASSSGKYHPIADLGKGGLVRHSIMVAEVSKILMRSRPLYDNDYDHDVVVASALLHDICKYSIPQKAQEAFHTNFDHPIKAAELIKKCGEDYSKEIGDDGFNYISLSVRMAKNIMSHMSRWNTSKYEPGLELPQITDEEQRIISDADLVAANSSLPEMMILFREEAIKNLVGR